jgi:hypothetical protein
VMNNAYLVQTILDFVGPGQHLYISTISKLVRLCYGTVQAIKCPVYRGGTLIDIIVGPQMTQFSELCRSESRLVLAVRHGVQIAPHDMNWSSLRCMANDLLAICSSGYQSKLSAADAADPQWQQKVSLGRYADKALLTFAYNHLELSFFSYFITLGAVMSGDLDKLQWLCTVENVSLCPESSFMAARYGHTNILKWFYHIKFPFHERTCCEAAFQGRLDVLRLLHAEGHEWHEDTHIFAFQGGHLDVVQWLGQHGCAYDTATVTRLAAYFGHGAHSRLVGAAARWPVRCRCHASSCKGRAAAHVPVLAQH